MTEIAKTYSWSARLTALDSVSDRIAEKTRTLNDLLQQLKFQSRYSKSNISTPASIKVNNYAGVPTPSLPKPLDQSSAPSSHLSSNSHTIGLSASSSSSSPTVAIQSVQQWLTRLSFVLERGESPMTAVKVSAALTQAKESNASTAAALNTLHSIHSLIQQTPLVTGLHNHHAAAAAAAPSSAAAVAGKSSSLPVSSLSSANGTAANSIQPSPALSPSHSQEFSSSSSSAASPTPDALSPNQNQLGANSKHSSLLHIQALGGSAPTLVHGVPIPPNRDFVNGMWIRKPRPPRAAGHMRRGSDMMDSEDEPDPFADISDFEAGGADSGVSPRVGHLRKRSSFSTQNNAGVSITSAASAAAGVNNNNVDRHDLGISHDIDEEDVADLPPSVGYSGGGAEEEIPNDDEDPFAGIEDLPVDKAQEEKLKQAELARSTHHASGLGASPSTSHSLGSHATSHQHARAHHHAHLAQKKLPLVRATKTSTLRQELAKHMNMDRDVDEKDEEAFQAKTSGSRRPSVAQSQQAASAELTGVSGASSAAITPSPVDMHESDADADVEGPSPLNQQRKFLAADAVVDEEDEEGPQFHLRNEALDDEDEYGADDFEVDEGGNGSSSSGGAGDIGESSSEDVLQAAVSSKFSHPSLPKSAPGVTAFSSRKEGQHLPPQETWNDMEVKGAHLRAASQKQAQEPSKGGLRIVQKHEDRPDDLDGLDDDEEEDENDEEPIAGGGAEGNGSGNTRIRVERAEDEDAEFADALDKAVAKSNDGKSKHHLEIFQDGEALSELDQLSPSRPSRGFGSAVPSPSNPTRQSSSGSNASASLKSSPSSTLSPSAAVRSKHGVSSSTVSASVSRRRNSLSGQLSSAISDDELDQLDGAMDDDEDADAKTFEEKLLLASSEKKSATDRAKLDLGEFTLDADSKSVLEQSAQHRRQALGKVNLDRVTALQAPIQKKWLLSLSQAAGSNNEPATATATAIPAASKTASKPASSPSSAASSRGNTVASTPSASPRSSVSTGEHRLRAPSFLLQPPSPGGGLPAGSDGRPRSHSHSHGIDESDLAPTRASLLKKVVRKGQN